MNARIGIVSCGHANRGPSVARILAAIDRADRRSAVAGEIAKVPEVLIESDLWHRARQVEHQFPGVPAVSRSPQLGVVIGDVQVTRVVDIATNEVIARAGASARRPGLPAVGRVDEGVVVAHGVADVLVIENDVIQVLRRRAAARFRPGRAIVNGHVNVTIGRSGPDATFDVFLEHLDSLPIDRADDNVSACCALVIAVADFGGASQGSAVRDDNAIAILSVHDDDARNVSAD